MGDTVEMYVPRPMGIPSNVTPTSRTATMYNCFRKKALVESNRSTQLHRHHQKSWTDYGSLTTGRRNNKREV